eukprot:7308375-Prymnesium_polylepis.1
MRAASWPTRLCPLPGACRLARRRAGRTGSCRRAVRRRETAPLPASCPPAARAPAPPPAPPFCAGGEDVGAPLPRDLSLVVLESLPAYPVLPGVPDRPPAGLTYVHDGVDGPAVPQAAQRALHHLDLEWEPVLTEELARLPAVLLQRLLSAGVL